MNSSPFTMMIRGRMHLIFAGLLATGGMVISSAYGSSLRLSNMFTNHMVLQQKRPDPIWGWGTPHRKVSLHFDGRTIRTTVNSLGQWIADLPVLPAGTKSYSLSVSSGNRTIKLHDILVGEVWICSGQSNMQYPMSGWFGRKNLAPLLAKATHPHIRLYQVPMLESNFSGYPLANAKARWQACSPKTVAPFSAVGYLFGRRLEKKLHVPVGLIESDWGGTNIEAWIPASGYRLVPQLRTDNQWLKKMLPLVITDRSRYIASIRRWARMAESSLKQNLALPPMPTLESDPIRRPHAFHYNIRPVGWQPDPHQNPTTLFNGMIAPLIPYGIRGVIWYQGENNVLTHDRRYGYHLEALINGWRKLWGQGNFPFYIMQIAPCKYWQGAAFEPLVWQGEEWAAEHMKNSGLVPTMDIGEINNIHPRNKPAAARRMADLALARTYHLPGYTWSGAMLKSAQVKAGRITVHFMHTFGGLLVKGGGTPDDFEIAGSNGRFQPAQAQVHGRTVIVSSPVVKHPVMVRFAWSDIAVPNLFNRRGWPALPFQWSAEPKQ